MQRLGHSGESEDHKEDAMKTVLGKQCNDKMEILRIMQRWFENLGDDFQLFNRNLVNLVEQVDAGYVVPDNVLGSGFEKETCLFPSTTSMRSSTVASQRSVMSALEILRR